MMSSNDSDNTDDVFSSEELRAVFKQLGYDIDAISEQIDAIVQEWCTERYNIPDSQQIESENDVK